MDVLIGVDIGTHSTKAVALEVGGRRLGEASCSHGIEIPQAGYCEQDAERVWWQGFVTVVRQLLKQGTFRPEEVRSIGVSTLSPCVLAVDDLGNPLRKAILYGVDVRASKQIARFNQELGLGDGTPALWPAHVLPNCGTEDLVAEGKRSGGI